MKPFILGKKVGMTRIYNDEGRQIPVTVIEAGPCVVTQVKTETNEEGLRQDGYNAIQIGFDEVKPRRSTFQIIGHDAKADAPPQRFHREIRVEADELAEVNAGDAVTVSVFEGVMFVDVAATSKGKGFQGTVKRHGFKGQLASHGVKRRHRSPGSIAGHASNPGKSGKIKKGKKMAGHMGNVRVSARAMEVVGIDEEKNLLIVKGAVPGGNGSLVEVKESVRLSKRKQNLLKAS